MAKSRQLQDDVTAFCRQRSKWMAELKEIVNLNKFVGHLTNDEQQQLLKLLPSTDTSEASDRNLYSIARLRRMFDSPQFKENLLSFQNYYKCSPMNILSLAEKLMKDAAARAKQVVNVGRGSMLILTTTQIDHQSYGLLVAIYCHLVDAHMRKVSSMAFWKL
ncbi:hypothetical protein OROMI_020816 [Orobanche minor]